MHPTIREAIDLQGGIIKLRGQSMKPFYRAGQALKIDSVRTRKLLLGEVVLVERGSHLSLHRLISSPRWGFYRTAGDARWFPDDVISFDQIKGLVCEPQGCWARFLNYFMSSLTILRFQLVGFRSNTKNF